MGNRGNRWKSCEIVAQARGIVGNRWEIVGNRGNGAQSLIPEQCVSPQFPYLSIYYAHTRTLNRYSRTMCGGYPTALRAAPPPCLAPEDIATIRNVGRNWGVYILSAKEQSVEDFKSTPAGQVLVQCGASVQIDRLIR